MNLKNFFRQTLMAFLIVTSLLITPIAHAEIKIYEGVGEYTMNDETIDFAKEQAELSAHNDILEQVGIYVRKIASMTDHELDEEEIISIGTGILRVKETKFKISDGTEAILVIAFVTAEIDMEEFKALLEQEIKKHAPKK